MSYHLAGTVVRQGGIVSSDSGTWHRFPDGFVVSALIKAEVRYGGLCCPLRAGLLLDLRYVGHLAGADEGLVASGPG